MSQDRGLRSGSRVVVGSDPHAATVWRLLRTSASGRLGELVEEGPRYPTRWRDAPMAQLWPAAPLDDGWHERRDPYVGEGAEGCRRSADIDLSEADTLTIESPQWWRAVRSADRWQAQAAALDATERAG